MVKRWIPSGNCWPFYLIRFTLFTLNWPYSKWMVVCPSMCFCDDSWDWLNLGTTLNKGCSRRRWIYPPTNDFLQYIVNKKNHLVRRRPCQLWAVICHNSWVACDEWWTSETAVVPANEKKLFTPLFPSSLHPQGSALKAWINQRFHIDPYFHRVTYITHSSGTLISSWIILTSGWIQTNAVPLLVSHVWY